MQQYKKEKRNAAFPKISLSRTGGKRLSKKAPVFRGLISILGHYDIQLISLPS